MSIAMNIVELATEAARAQGAKAIESIELEIGTLAGVMPEALEFCFTAAAGDTLAQGAELKIRTIPARGKCPSCAGECDILSFAEPCPQCGGPLLNLSQGRDLRILAITIDE
jgi:hydrogenase nickel incorporation protein HypA/HybF